MHKFLLVTLATAAASAAPAAAQDGPGGGLDDIVITARRIETGLQDTPIAVTALTATAIDNLQIRSTEDVSRAVPGLTLNPVSANPSTFQIGLRGGSEQTGGLIVSEPVVGIYLDDVYRGRLQGSNFQLTDIERIEVLRGPQGTLYGRNTFSGALKIITRTPGADSRWLNASVGAGSFEEWRADGSVGGPLAGNLGASVAFLYRDQAEGWIQAPARGRKIGRERNAAVRGKLAFDDGSLRVIGTLGYTSDRNDGYIPVNVRFDPDAARIDYASRVFTKNAFPAIGNNAYVNVSPTPSRGETDVVSASLDIAYDFGPVTLRSITGFVRVDDLFRWDLTGGLNPAPGIYVATFERLSTTDAEQWSQELQLNGRSLDDRLTWIGGIYYFREKGRQDFLDTLGLFGLPTFPLFEQRTRTQSWAVFAQASFDLSARTALTLGGRYTSDDKSFDARIAPPANVSVALDETFNAFTPHVGVQHRFSDDIMAYASVSRGFKAGGFNGLSRDPRVLAQSYRPQKVWAYELGLKTEFLDRRVRANLAAFFNDISDLQQTVTRPDGTFPQQNVGDARVIGIEAEVSARPVKGLDLAAALSWNDDAYRTLDPQSDASVAGARGLPLVSDWTLRLAGSYEQPVGDTLVARIGGNLSHTGEFFANVTNVLVVNPYTRLDGFVGLRTANGRWDLTLSGQNLTDTVTYVSGIVSAPFPTALTPLKPRTWRLTLKMVR